MSATKQRNTMTRLLTLASSLERNVPLPKHLLQLPQIPLTDSIIAETVCCLGVSNANLQPGISVSCAALLTISLLVPLVFVSASRATLMGRPITDAMSIVHI